jgi:hypothetical protein
MVTDRKIDHLYMVSSQNNNLTFGEFPIILFTTHPAYKWKFNKEMNEFEVYL